jgi:predicted nucleotidyltransferase
MNAIHEWAARHPIAEVWLYGSRARGTHRPDSDVDLAVIMIGHDVDDRLAVFITRRVKQDLVLPNGAEAHVEWYDPEDDTSERVGPGVRADGIRIYP